MPQERNVTSLSGLDKLTLLERAKGFEPSTPTLARGGRPTLRYDPLRHDKKFAKATMLSCDDRPSHISETNIHSAVFSKGEPKPIPVEALLTSRVWPESGLGAGSDSIQRGEERWRKGPR